MPVITGYNLRCEGPQRLAHRAFAQPLQGAVAQLADALARDAEHAADLLQGVLAPAVQPEVEAQHLRVALLETVQRRLDLVGQEAVHRLLFRVREVLGDEALDQGAVAVGIKRRVEAHVARVEGGERLHHLERQLGGVGDLLRRRLAAARRSGGVGRGGLLTSGRSWSGLSRSSSCGASAASMRLRRPRLRPGFAAARAGVALAAGVGAFFLGAGLFFFLCLRMRTCINSARYTTAGRKCSRIDMDSLDSAITPGYRHVFPAGTRVP